MRLGDLPSWRACVQGLAITALLSTSPVSAQERYPARHITIIVPQVAGSATDNVVRPVAQAMHEMLGQPVIVDNRAGANGVIGMDLGARAASDGYTFTAISNTTMAANPNMYKKLPYDPERDFVPVAMLGRTSMMYVVRPDFPASSIDTLLAEAGKPAKRLSAGFGSSTAQVALSMLTTAAGMSVTPVPYQGTPKLLIDLIGGVVDFAVVDVGSGMQQINAGKIKPLAIAASQRLGVSGSIPTLAEKYPGVHMDTWIALAAPRGTAREQILKLNTAVNAALSRPEVRKAFEKVAIDPSSATPEELGEIIKADMRKWPGMIKAAGIEPQ